MGTDNDNPVMTPNERLVWAATYGACYYKEGEFWRTHGKATSRAQIAVTAAEWAWSAVDDLRNSTKNIADAFGDDSEQLAMANQMLND